MYGKAPGCKRWVGGAYLDANVSIKKIRLEFEIFPTLMKMICVQRESFS